jgi:type II secretory pathway pseudopilin PulG
MLAVIAIIGLLAGIVVPNLAKFKPNVSAGAERLLVAELTRARQLAISQSTTVYMVFVPTNFWANSVALNPNSAAYTKLSTTQPLEEIKAERLYDKQLVGYTFVALKTLGDQPGQNNPHYFAPWRTLPEGVYIPLEKFGPRKLPPSQASAVLSITNATPPYWVVGFTNFAVPFPSEQSTNYFYLPCVAFDFQGQLVSQMDEIIPLAKGTVSFARNGDKTPKALPATITEIPAGNATNSYDLIKVEWLTGRAHAERLEVR